VSAVERRHRLRAVSAPAIVVLAVALVALALGGCGRSPFDAKTADGATPTFDTVERVLLDAGLEVREAAPVDWTGVAGLESGTLFEVSPTGRETDDTTATTVLVASFATRDDRDAAINHEEWRPFEHPTAAVWTWGPLVILVEGERDDEVVARIDEALRAAGAK